jgi:hypothetical protein
MDGGGAEQPPHGPADILAGSDEQPCEHEAAADLIGLRAAAVEPPRPPLLKSVTRVCASEDCSQPFDASVAVARLFCSEDCRAANQDGDSGGRVHTVYKDPNSAVSRKVRDTVSYQPPLASYRFCVCLAVWYLTVFPSITPWFSWCSSRICIRRRQTSRL